MIASIAYVSKNPEQFKVCNLCGHINWKENAKCVHDFCESYSFNDSPSFVEHTIENKKREHRKKQASEDEIGGILFEV